LAARGQVNWRLASDRVVMPISQYNDDSEGEV
jgi:hypothetical protein